jgi:hypothetical protein
MKSFKNVSDTQYQTPPPGNYRTKIVAATDKVSKTGNTMIEIEVEILEPEQFAGASCRDWIITEPTAKGASLAKRKLTALGVDVDSDEEYPDSVLAQRLLGREVWTTFKHEQRMDKDSNGGYTVPVYEYVNGQQVPRMNLRVEKYGGVVNRAPQAAPVMQSSPQQQAAFQQQFAPQQQAPAFPQQAQQAQFQAPQQFAPQAAPQFPGYAQPQGNGAALPPWMQAQNGVPGVQPQEAASDEPKKRRKN